MDTSKYLQMFIDESKENLQQLNQSLLILETNPSDTETINIIFRVAHTLKGMAGSMGFLKMQKLTHALENILSDVRDKKLELSSEIADSLFQSLDALEIFVSQIEKTSFEGDFSIDPLVSRLEAIKNPSGKKSSSTVTTSLKLSESANLVIKEARNKNFEAFNVNVRIAKDCTLKSVRAYMVISTTEQFGDVIDCNPCTKDLEDDKFDFEFTFAIISNYSEKEIKETLMSISEIESVEVSIIEDNSIQIEKKETLINPKIEKFEKSNAKLQSNKSVRVNIDRLDSLMNLVSELIIVKTQLEEKNKTAQNNEDNALEYLNRITSSLHDSVMKIRMVPVETVFNRYPRMIRDISKTLGKEIELIMSGEETELDRTIIDEINDPLVHLLRNASDHGLESPEERIKAGKPSIGTIHLRAYPDGNNVIIEVKDDGHGIDVLKVKQKAIEKGTITNEAAAAMSDKEIIDLLFRPSFSTSEQVSNLSGRGVGLDVVKSKITEIGGEIEVQTELGKGSTFIIRLPLTLAIIQTLMVEVDKERYALPLNEVESIESIHTEKIKYVENQKVILLRDEVVPLIFLSDVLQCGKIKKDHLMVVIVEYRNSLVGLVVDSVLGQQEVVIKSLGKHLNHLSFIAGATILGNGEVALILDSNNLIKKGGIK